MGYLLRIAFYIEIAIDYIKIKTNTKEYSAELYFFCIPEAFL